MSRLVLFLSICCLALVAVPAGASAPYRPPVDAPVVDGFRLPAGPFGAGNRGLEYDTEPGTPVRAIGAGRVVFAGPVAGQLHVTVLHPDGLRSSYSYLAEVVVTAGVTVEGGQVVGRAAERLHLGVRSGDRYLDPASLFAVEGVRLVPVGSGSPDSSGYGSAPPAARSVDQNAISAGTWRWLLHR